MVRIMRRFYDISEGVKKFNSETFEMRQSSRLWINAQSVFFSLHFSICCVAITHMASSSRRLYLFLQLICISRISQNKVLADDCPFEKEVKCILNDFNQISIWKSKPYITEKMCVRTFLYQLISFRMIHRQPTSQASFLFFKLEEYISTKIH